MSTNDIKLAILNILAFLISFSHVENVLKILLLIISIVYTGLKTFELIKNKKYNGQNNYREDTNSSSKD